MSQSNGHIIVLGSVAYLDLLKDVYGEDRVHFPLDTKEWEHDKNVALAKLFESAADETITILELNYAANRLTWTETDDLLKIVQEHKSGLVVLTDMYTKTLEEQVEGVFTEPHTVLDANTARFRDIQSAIDSFLESPGPFHPELEL